MPPLIAAKRALAFLHDLLAVAVCWLLSYWLRFNLDIPNLYLASAQRALLLVLGISAPMFWALGLYRGIWRYASLMDLRRIIIAAGLSSPLVAAAALLSATRTGLSLTLLRLIVKLAVPTLPSDEVACTVMLWLVAFS